MTNLVTLTTKELLELNKEFITLTSSKVKHKRLNAKKINKIISEELIERNVSPCILV